MHCNINNMIYLKYSHQHASAGISAIFRVMLLQECKCQIWLEWSHS